MKDLFLLLVLALAALATCSVVASARSYPSKPARIVVAFPPGSATDIVGCILAQKLSDMWKQAVIVDNRGGAPRQRNDQDLAGADNVGNEIRPTGYC